VLIRVLGSAAGGGFPQWNCNCRNCHGIRHGSLRAVARTQSSIAVSSDTRRWLLCNASPDLHRQIAANPALQPRQGARDTPISGVVLVDGQIDHAMGLLLLREHREMLDVWTTDPVRDDLSNGLPLLSVLEHYCGIRWHRLNAESAPVTVSALPGILVAALPVDGMPGPYSAHRQSPRIGDNVALVFRDERTNAQLFYAPGLGAMTARVEEALHASTCVLVDGTFWRDDEMVREGVSTKRAREIGHLPQSGPGGMIDVLSQLPAATRRVLIHINNTNPILDEDSPERAALVTAGIEVAFDGMEIAL
jgi:pyrroloquinoline quinone biosynthesis protein B